jgi:RNA polymerase sigma-70 factor (ECF subfamily)
MSRSCSISDEELVRKFTAGDVKAFETLVARYQKPVVNFIYRMIGDFHQAEDMGQEVFIKVYRFAHTYEERSSFATWIFGIASNLCCDVLRIKSHWDLLYLDANRENIRGHLLTGDTSPESHVESLELGKLIEIAIGKLPVHQRQAIVLREYYGFSYTDIAEVAGCSLAAVKSRIYKAKQQLRRKLSFLID